MPITKMNETEAEKIKARRAIRLIYFLTAVFIIVPIALYFFVR